MTKSNFTIEVTDDGSHVQVHLWHEGRYLAQISPLDNGPGLEIHSSAPAIADVGVKPSWAQYSTIVRIPEKQAENDRLDQ